MDRIRVSEVYPVELHSIKILFLQQEYRQCIQACHDIMAATEDSLAFYPVQHAFLEFYLAMAFDEIARATHQHSNAKLPAYAQAEAHFRKALEVLPDPDQSGTLIVAALREGQAEGASSETASHSNSATSLGLACSSPGAAITPANHLSMMTPAPASPIGTSSEVDDFDSPSSFDQIMTPSRVPRLTRDYSSMSLLQPTLPLSTRTLLRPVRMGSPPRPYRPGSRASSAAMHQLGYIHESEMDSLPETPRKSESEAEFRSRSPFGSPVSALHSGTSKSDGSTVSPVATKTPTESHRSPRMVLPRLMDARARESTSIVRDHLLALRAQLAGHIERVNAARDGVVARQAELSQGNYRTGDVPQALPADATSLGGSRSRSTPEQVTTPESLARAQSYWSFTPEDVKVQERQRRIQAGRERGWARKRFDPNRSMLLAQQALHECGLKGLV